MKLLKKTAVVLVVLVGIYYAAFGVFYAAGFRWYFFPTAAMEPTIPKGDHVFGRLSETYRNHIRRFEIAIYVPKESPTEIYAKRVIGLPGERVVITMDGVTINQMKLELPAMVNVQGLGAKPCDIVVPTDAIFVLGDNTPRSSDSRYVGPISKQNVIGRILFKK